jgi:hypothetical protein
MDKRSFSVERIKPICVGLENLAYVCVVFQLEVLIYWFLALVEKRRKVGKITFGKVTLLVVLRFLTTSA